MIFTYKELKINYEIFDEREEKNDDTKPLLLLHGWMANIPAWAPVYNYFKKTRPVYVIDFPGQGGKSCTLNEVWGVPEYSYMVKEFIKEMQIEKCDVIGHSFGGRVIIYLASKYKDLFNRIILTDSAGILPKTSAVKAIKKGIFGIGKNVLKTVLSSEKYDEAVEGLRKKTASSDYAALDNEIMRESFKKIVNLDLKENLKEINNSTLIIWGENDQETPMYMAKIMEEEIKDSGLVVLENAGHFSYLDNSTKYLIVANEFLK